MKITAGIDQHCLHQAPIGQTESLCIYQMNLTTLMICRGLAATAVFFAYP
jgi:hypothetical protein